MFDLQVCGLTKSYGATVVLHGIDLQVSAGSLTAILGPSGCGKTTLLRLIGGFDLPDAGRICLGERILCGSGRPVPPERRRIGYVAQEGALFPHLTVAENVRFGLRMAPEPGKRRIEELLAMVGLDLTLAGRYPHQLSGGQQQRVALARALAPEPAAILLDEPFASLDAGLRDSTRRAVAGLLASFGTTTILVTHDQAEAFSMADQVAVMRQGRLVQVAPPANLYLHPVDAEVAISIGEAVILPAEIDDGVAVCALGALPIGSGVADGRREVMIRPEQITILPLDAEYGTPASVLEISFYGHDALARLALQDGTVVLARPPGFAAPATGENVALVVQGPVHAF
jgi:iron(III) transport system ATP-binding protein